MLYLQFGGYTMKYEVPSCEIIVLDDCIATSETTAPGDTPIVDQDAV